MPVRSGRRFSARKPTVSPAPWSTRRLTNPPRSKPYSEGFTVPDLSTHGLGWHQAGCPAPRIARRAVPAIDGHARLGALLTAYRTGKQRRLAVPIQVRHSLRCAQDVILSRLLL